QASPARSRQISGPARPGQTKWSGPAASIGWNASRPGVSERPLGEGARKSKIHPGAIPGNLVRNDFWRRGGPGGRSLVFGYLLGAILFHGVLGLEFGYRTGVLILTREPDR